MEADKVLTATRKALSKCSHLLKGEEKALIGEAVSRTEAAISRNDTAGIKESTTELNQATEHLASLLLGETAKEVVEKKNVSS